jgi:catechol 2,3-dioxygenase-like lactoylglutathione lyase family enzyme
MVQGAMAHISVEQAMKFGAVTPILRMFDIAKAREFYLGFLGFKVEFEHRFEPDLPLYMEVSRGDCRLHLSEHHGDAAPGSAIRIAMEGIEDFHAELTAKKYGYARPGLETTPWAREIRLTDPFFNRLVFVQANETDKA